MARNKNHVNITSPLLRFHKIFDILKLFARTCGINVFAEDFRFGRITFAIFNMVQLIIALNAYTLWDSISKGKFAFALQNVCIMNTGIQSYAKLVTSVYYQKMIRYVCAEIDFMYRTYENEGRHYVKCLNESLNLLIRITIFMFKLYAVLTVAEIAVPLYYQLYRKERLPIFDVIIPLVDPATDWGFMIHQICTGIATTLTGFGNFAADTSAIMMLVHTRLMSRIIKCKFDDLDEVIRETPREQRNTEHMVKDILEWHQRYLKFTQANSTLMYWGIFIEITAAYISIIFNMVSIFIGGWTVAPIYLFASYCLLLGFCSMGNLIEVSNEELTTNIYDCMWYELSVPEQKLLLIMLNQSQKPNGISLGGLAPLSLNTAVQLTKSIYTVAMLIHSYLSRQNS
uniref:Odorant receptor n=1 Tax=Stomoxys calcitrans TaxID=35570 RepID=A0A1I8P9A2_STOCA